jgi:signal transduction histidine kinase/ligand-binding sensor domain-containing protein
MRKFLHKTAGMALMLGLAAVLLDPAAWPSPLPVTEYHHTMWTADNGLGAVFDIEQAPDGYLWLTTSTGVFRFDGVRFQSVEEATNGAVQNSEIHSAFLSPTGGIWLKTRAAGLLFWKDGRLTVFTDRRCTPALQIEGLAEDQDGALWVQGSGGLFRMRGPVCEPIGAEHGYPGGFPAAILVDRKGTVWVRTLAGDLLFLPRGQSSFQSIRYAAGPITAAFVLAAPTRNAFLHQAPDGAIWLSDTYGLRRVVDAAGAPLPSPPSTNSPKNDIQFGDFSFAADGSLWAVTDRGVRRFDQVDRWPTPAATQAAPGEGFTTGQGLSSNAAWKVLIDREGSVWVGTNSGLDHLRRTPLHTLALPQTAEHDFGVTAGDHGSVWTGNRSLPLTEIGADGDIRRFPETNGTICIRRDRSGAIWSAGGGDSRLWRYSGTGLTLLPSPEEEKAGPVVSLAVDRNNDLWISTAIGGTYLLRHGVWSSQNEALGKRSGLIGAMAGDEAGNVWFGFANNLVRWDGSAYQKFSFPNGARGVSESTLSVRGDRVWLGGPGGIELFTHGHFYLLRWKDNDLPGRVSGVIETGTGELWANGFSGITHVPADELTRWLRDPMSAISGERLNALDGLPGFSAERIPEPSIAESREGRLWFATTKGITWLEPAKLRENRNPLPPPVLISSILSDGKTYVASNGLSLPARTDKLEIDYTALSFAVPERVQFRYKLDGVDDGWQDAGTRRQAFYTSLSPRRYRFHVIACNNDGVWNEAGATTEFSIAPAWFQTAWFTALCVCVLLLLLWTLYQLRLRQLAQQFHLGIEARVDERTRIARELHDTLLQSFNGLLLRFQAVSNLLPARPDEAKQRVDSAIEEAARAITEGRDAVHALRSTGSAAADLAESIGNLGKELLSQPANDETPEFRVQVEGTPRSLNPIVRDEAYRIAAEALRNAVRHARARQIEVEIRYSEQQLRLRIRDDGKGIDRTLLDRDHAPGHWGLRGMRERAKLIGGILEIWSELNSGAEIELTVPAASAYAKPRTSRWFAPSGIGRS